MPLQCDCSAVRISELPRQSSSLIISFEWLSCYHIQIAQSQMSAADRAALAEHLSAGANDFNKLYCRTLLAGSLRLRSIFSEGVAESARVPQWRGCRAGIYARLADAHRMKGRRLSVDEGVRRTSGEFAWQRRKSLNIDMISRPAKPRTPVRFRPRPPISKS